VLAVEQPFLLFQSLLLAVPFGYLAVDGTRDWLPWSVAILVTGLFWGAYVASIEIGARGSDWRELRDGTCHARFANRDHVRSLVRQSGLVTAMPASHPLRVLPESGLRAREVLRTAAWLSVLAAFLACALSRTCQQGDKIALVRTGKTLTVGLGGCY